jgi:hypothetical protein
LCSFCHKLSVLQRAALQIWADADFVRSGFGARLMLWPEKEPAEREGFVPDDLDARLVVLGVDHAYIKEPDNAWDGLRPGGRSPGLHVSRSRRAFCADSSGRQYIYAPGKRPFHPIIPGFVTKDDQPFLSFGLMRGDM